MDELLDHIASHKIFIISSLLLISSLLIGLIIVTQIDDRGNCYHSEEGICEFITQTQKASEGQYQVEYVESEAKEKVNHLKWWYGPKASELAAYQDDAELYRLRKIGNRQYVYNPQENVWWEQKSSPQNDYNTEFAFNPEPYIESLIETSLDIKTQFRFLGKESCGEESCLWYEIVPATTAPVKTYLYIYESTYKLHSIVETLPNENKTIAFGYEEISIEKPEKSVVVQDSRNLILDILALQKKDSTTTSSQSFDYVEEFLRQREQAEDEGSTVAAPKFIEEEENDELP